MGDRGNDRMSTDRVTGDAPQPGETPRTESERWSFADPNQAWWRVEEERGRQEVLASARPRHPRRRAAPVFAPEALDAHAAGTQDVAESIAPPAALVEAEHEAEIEETEAVAAGKLREPVERDHDRRPRDRYQPPRKDSDVDEKKPEEPAEPVPDVMVLPEPNRDRPTVALPGQAVAGTSRLGKAADEAKRERLENHPFWRSEEERKTEEERAAWPAPEVRERLATGAGRPPARKPRNPRGPAAGLLGLVALALIAAFFSWVSAEPFWLSAGHGDSGVATVSQCTGDGVTLRCRGSFAAGDGSFAIEEVTLLGVDAGSRNTGAHTPARMVSPDSRQAYVGGPGVLLYLRWTLGFALVVLCGYAIAGMTGARRLETAKARRNAVLISLAGPILLLVGFLAAAY